MYKFKLDEIPSNIPIHQFLIKNTDVLEQGKNLEEKFSSKFFIKKSLPVNFKQLQKDVLEALELFPPVMYAPKEELVHECYRSLFLTSNPESKHPFLNPLVTQSTEHLETGKNSLMDFISNNQKSAAGNYKSISELFDKALCTYIGSRIAILDGSHPQSTQLNFQWHTDSSIFISSRINIPIVSAPHFGIQIATPEKEFVRIELEENFMYLYNTNLPHRPTNNFLSPIKRVNLIMSLMPWFNIDHEDKIIYSNSNYGKIHPFSMFQENLLI